MTIPSSDAFAPVLWTPEQIREQARALSKSSLVKPLYRNNEHNIVYAAELGRSFGLSPAVSLQMIHVFESGSEGFKTAISADLMIALARGAGHNIHIVSTPAKVTGTLRRFVSPHERENLKDLGYTLEEIQEMSTFTEIWDQKRAVSAGLMTKKNWQNYTEDMLRSRVKSGLVRLACSEVLLGIMHTADELGAETDAEGFPVEGRHSGVHSLGNHRAEQRATVTVTQVREPAAKPTTKTGTEPVEESVVDADIEEETSTDTAAEQSGLSAQSVADYALSVVNDSDLTTMEKIKKIHSTIKNVGEYGMNDSPVTIGETEPVGLEEALNNFARHLVRLSKAEAKEKAA